MTLIKHRRMNRQTDWQGERNISSLWSITSWISISITGSLLGGTQPGVWVGGVKPPHCQQWLASSSTVWCLCIVFLPLLFSFTPVWNYTRICVQLNPPIFHLIILLSLPWCHHPPFYKHLHIFKYNVIKTEFTSTLVVESPHSHSNHSTNRKIIEWLRL